MRVTAYRKTHERVYRPISNTAAVATVEAIGVMVSQGNGENQLRRIPIPA